MQEEELKRAVERAELAEAKLKGIEEELQAVGEIFELIYLSIYLHVNVHLYTIYI